MFHAILKFYSYPYIDNNVNTLTFLFYALTLEQEKRIMLFIADVW